MSQTAVSSVPSSHPAASGSGIDAIRQQLVEIFCQLTGLDPARVDLQTPFLEMGADSIVLVKAVRAVNEAFGVELTIAQLFEDFPTMDSLAAHLEQVGGQEVPTPAPAAPAPAPAPAAPAPVAVQPLSQPLPAPVLPAGVVTGNGSGETGIQAVVARQLEAFSQGFSQIAMEQLRLLGGASVPAPAHTPGVAPAAPPATPATPAPPAPQPAAPAAPRSAPKANGSAPVAAPKPTAHGPYRPPEMKARETDERQKAHFDALQESYNRKTAGSKAYMQTHRRSLADSRAAIGFRPSTKEMLYSIVAKRADGSRIWDIDDNEYIDMTMGFGVHLFGHRPPFVVEALEEQLSRSFAIGPRPELVGEAAELICEVANVERASIGNTGTEAVMTALRLARTATQRNRVALFAGSYHGHYDGILASGAVSSGERARPVVPGVSPRFVEDLLVLDYSDPEGSLQTLEAHKDELAALLVEPVQGSRPGLQPRDFLHQLRDWSRRAGVVLIFDEMVTGFRIHPGGAQAWFDVEADLVTYGKVIGGGTHIGVIGGKSEFMDGVDGGFWSFGDDSYPRAQTTMVGGTFMQHPLSVAACQAVLLYLKEQGPELQEKLNARTTAMVETINAFFEAEEVPMRAVHFGSYFRFSFQTNMDLFFFHLLNKGFYVWEWRTCFLSTAHSDEDIERFVDAVKESIYELRRGGFLPGGREKEAAVSVSAKTPSTDAEDPWSVAIAAAGNVAGRLPKGLEIDRVRARHQALDHLTSAQIRQLLADLGVADSEAVESSINDGKVEAKFRPLLERWLRRIGESPEESSDLETARAAARELFDDDHPLLAWIERCEDLLPKVLAGETEAFEALMPGGSMATMEYLYHDASSARYVHSIAAAALGTFAHGAARGAGGKRRLEVLEVGAGIGGATSALVPSLDPETTRYTVTEVAPALLEGLQAAFADSSFVRTALLDIEADIEILPEDQEEPDLHGLDVVVAVNSLHVVGDIHRALSNVESMLAPGGVLLLVEGTKTFPWFDLSLLPLVAGREFTDGLRGESPLLSLSQWRSALRDQGLQELAVFPVEGSSIEAIGQHLILARKPAESRG